MSKEIRRFYICNVSDSSVFFIWEQYIPSPSLSTTTSHKNALRVIFLPVALSVDLVELLRSMAFGGGGGGSGSAERCLERGRDLTGDNNGPMLLTGYFD